MQKKSKLFNKQLTSTLLAMGVLTSSFAGYNFIYNKKHDSSNVVYAYTQTLNKITNADFSYASSSTPATPSSGWSKITDKGSSENQIVSGVYNQYSYSTGTENYLEDYNLIDATTPGTIDGVEPTSSTLSDAKFKSLMINSAKVPGNFGYKSTSDIDLDANSYYAFDITLKTFHNVENPESSENGYASTFNSFASIYLNGLGDKASDANFEKVESFNSVTNTYGWATYTIFVQTSEFNSLNDLNLELWLGSKNESCTGPVFFNSVALTQYSKDAFEEAVINTPASNKRVVRLTNEYTITDAVQNNQFDLPISSGWTYKTVNIDEDNGQVVRSVDYKSDDISAITGKVNADYSFATKDIPANSNLQWKNNTKLLLINNPREEHEAVLQSSNINILQHGYYRITVWAWRNTSDGSPVISLVDVNERKEKVDLSVSTTSTSDNFTGGWNQYNFYVAGNGYRDEVVALQLGLSGKGYVYYDDVQVRQISFADYETGKSKSYSSSLSFDTSTTNYQVTNDDFDVTANEDYSITYPLAPQSWTSNLDEDETLRVAGVVNTDSSSFTANLPNYSKGGMHPNNPGALPLRSENNNVLMIGNFDSEMNNYFTSSSISLSSGKYYHITTYVAANSLDGNGGAYIKCYSDKDTLFEYSNIIGSWALKEIYIATGTDTISAHIDLGNTAQGYAFFDKVQVEETTQDVFNAVTSSKIDLSYESFENLIDDSSEWKFSASNYSATNKSETSVESGIADLSKNQLDSIVTSAQDGHNVLYITSDEDSYYYLASNTSYSFSAGTYYKLSAYVQTHLNEPTEEKDGEVYGASLTLKIGDTVKTFYGINTTDNAWKEYTFYIHDANGSTGSLQLALGSDNGKISGLAMFDNIKLTTLENFDDIELDEYSQKVEIEATKTEPEEETPTQTNGFSWYLVPSLLTALAIFIAIIGALVRKVNWKRPTKVATSYDRSATLNKNVSNREQIAEREALIANLTATLQENEKQLSELQSKANEEEAELKATLDESNKELHENLKTIESERAKLEKERNAQLAKDKAGYTKEQDKKYSETLKSIEKAKKKYSNKLAAKEKQLTQMQQKHAASYESLKSKNAEIEKEIKELNKQISSIKRKELKRVGVQEKDIEITPPDEK